MRRIPIALQLGFSVVFVIPLVYLFLKAGSMRSFEGVLSSPGLPNLLVNTVWPALAGAAGALLLGTTYAWLVYRTDIPGKKLLSALPFLGLAIPAEIRAIGFVFLLSPKSGLVNQGFMWLFHVNFPLFDVFSNGGLILALATGGLPFNYILMSAAIRGMDSSLEDSSRIIGSSTLTTLRRVTIPMLFPALLAAYVINLVVSLGIFDYSFILSAASGSTSSVRTLATSIYAFTEESAPPDYTAATSIATIYLIITIIGISVYIWISRHQFRYALHKRERPSTYFLNRWRYLGTAICILIVTVAIFSLDGILALVSLMPYYDYEPSILGKLSLGNYQSLLFSNSYPLFWSSFLHSFMYSFVAALTTSLLAGFLVYAVLRSRTRWSRLLEYFNTIPFAIPGIVYGFALLLMFLYLPFLSDYVYGTIWAIIIAMVITWVPFAVRIQSGSVLYIPREVEDAANVAGAGWWRTYRTILIPMVKASVLLSFAYVFLDTFRELGAVYLLANSQTYSLTTFIADLFATSPSTINVIAATSSIMVASMACFIALAYFLTKGNLLWEARD